MKRNTFLKGIASILGLSLIPFKGMASIKRNKVITFTPEILRKNNVGLYIINDKADVVENPDYAATVAWKLCWHLNRPNENATKDEKEFQLSENKNCKVNFLTDGWICPIGNTDEETCEYLNNNKYGEKYRIMTKEELFYIINHRNNYKQLFYE